ncbi:hypothetical protein [Azospirillum argentinense]|nr:hypothetical protein [Azospirillum argentinense]
MKNKTIRAAALLALTPGLTACAGIGEIVVHRGSRSTAAAIAP